MKILIFGATGGTGKELVKQALDAGHTVSVFVHKNTDALSDVLDKITVFQGDVRGYDATSSAVKGHDAVLVALGVVPGVTDTVLSKGTENIVKAMQAHGVRRLIVETGANLTEHRESLPWVWRVLAGVPPMRSMFNAKRVQEAIIKATDLEWVLVQPVNLSNGPLTGVYKEGETLHMSVGSVISRADVAHFMIRQIDDDTWLRRAVIVSKT